MLKQGRRIKACHEIFFRIVTYAFVFVCIFLFITTIIVASLRLEANDLTGTVPDMICAVFGEIFPLFATDCINEVTCPCCGFCCDDDDGCECQVEGTDMDFLCSEISEAPGLLARMKDPTGR